MTIGQWKRIFHVLHGEIRLVPEKVCVVITACAMVYNLCKQRNIPLPDDDGEEDDDDDEDDDGGRVPYPARVVGVAYRDHYINIHFG